MLKKGKNREKIFSSFKKKKEEKKEAQKWGPDEKTAVDWNGWLQE